jgi:hypothetical protein
MRKNIGEAINKHCNIIQLAGVVQWPLKPYTPSF